MSTEQLAFAHRADDARGPVLFPTMPVWEDAHATS